MPEYDVDLKTLEDMCSELSEACFLVNKELKILWHNESYKDFSHHIKDVVSEIFNGGHIPKGNLSQIFMTGRIMNLVLKNGLRITCIPVRYEDKVASVLCIIDNTVHSPIVHHFLDSIGGPALLFDKNMIYIGHNSLLDREFIAAPALLEIVLERLRSNTDDPKNDKLRVEKEKNNKIRVLKSLIGMSHDVKLKPLLSGKHTAGYILLVQRNIARSHKRYRKRG